MIVRLFVSLLAIVFASVSASAKYADIIFINGEIYTVDAKRSWAEAVSIKGNRILQVGTVKEAMTLLGDSTRIVDLNGKMMLAHAASATLRRAEKAEST